MKHWTSSIALLGDIVESRRGDRRRTDAALRVALRSANGTVTALDPLRTTVGDEFQGVYASLGAALDAVYRVRSRLDAEVDVRVGLGGGEVRVIDEESGIQDGSGWWRAREALDEAKRRAARPGYRSVRTVINDGRGTFPGFPVTEMVSLVDARVARLKKGPRLTLSGLLEGADNSSIAAAQGISDSAVSQHIRDNDLRIVADAIVAIRQLP